MDLIKDMQIPVIIALFVLVVKVNSSGYLTNSIDDLDYDFGLQNDPFHVNSQFEPLNSNLQVSYPFYPEVTTIRPPKNFLNLLRAKSTLPTFFNPMFKEKYNYQSNQHLYFPSSSLAYVTPTPDMRTTYHVNAPYNPVASPSQSYDVAPFQLIQKKQPQKLHTNEDYLEYMYRWNPFTQMMDQNEPSPFALTTSVKETPSMIKGLQTRMMGMFIRIKIMWQNMWNYLKVKFRPNSFLMQGRSFETIEAKVDDPQTTQDKSIAVIHTAKNHKETHKKHKKKHSHKHKHVSKDTKHRVKHKKSRHKHHIKHKQKVKDETKEELDDKPSLKDQTKQIFRQHHIHKRRPKIKKHRLRKLMMPLLMAYKLKFLTLIPVIIAGLVLLAGSTGMAGFFFALFTAVLSMSHKSKSG